MYKYISFVIKCMKLFLGDVAQLLKMLNKKIMANGIYSMLLLTVITTEDSPVCTWIRKNAMILSFRGRLSCAFGFFCLKTFYTLHAHVLSLSFGIIISMTFMHTFSFSILGPFLLAFCVKPRVFILFYPNLSEGADRAGGTAARR